MLSLSYNPKKTAVTMIETISNATAKNEPKRSSERTPGPNGSRLASLPQIIHGRSQMPIAMISAPKAIALYSLLLEPLSFLSASITGIPSPTDSKYDCHKKWRREKINHSSTISLYSKSKHYNNHNANSEYKQVSLCYSSLSCFYYSRE